MTVSTHKTFIFDTEKWLENRGLHRCSRITRSVIIDMMVYSVKHNGTFRVDEKSAIRIGATEEEWQLALSEIKQFNVTAIEDGMITFDCIAACIQKKETISQKRREAAESRWNDMERSEYHEPVMKLLSDRTPKYSEDNPLDANAYKENHSIEPTCPFMQINNDTKSVVCKCMKPWDTTRNAYSSIPRSYYQTTSHTIKDSVSIYNNIYNNIYNFRKGSMRGKPFVDLDTEPVVQTAPIVRRSRKSNDESLTEAELLSRMVIPDFGIPVVYDENGKTGNTYIDDIHVGGSTKPEGLLKNAVAAISMPVEDDLPPDIARCMDALKKRLKRPVLSDSEMAFCEWWCMYPVSRRRGGSMEKHFKLWEKNCKGDEERVLAYAEDYLYEFQEELKEEKYCMYSIRFLRTMDWENFEMENDD